MIITIITPNEFDEHWENDRFKESLRRMECDAANCKGVMAGNYEAELCAMLIAAFERATAIPLQNCRLLDETAAYDSIAEAAAEESGNYVDMDTVSRGLENAPAVFETDGDT